MNKLQKSLIIAITSLILFGCSSAYANENEKSLSDGDFTFPGNMVNGDLNIDGLLDEAEWELPENFGVTFGENERISVKLYRGEQGLTIGFVAQDQFISASRNFADPLFVVNSDNVEFYIDTKNNGGPAPQTDDYQFLINPDGYAALQVGGGRWWGPWSGVVDYAVSVQGTINNDADNDTMWSCELFLPYETFGFFADSIVGVAFGCRNKTTNLTSSDWFGWVPDPQIIDTYVSLAEGGITLISDGGYSKRSGAFSYDEEAEKFTSTTKNTIIIKDDASFVNGSIESEILAPSTSDNGLIFAQSSQIEAFWESYASYYFFFVDIDENAHLGKVSNGQWETLQLASTLHLYTPGLLAVLKIGWDGEHILGFVNGTLLIDYTDDNPLDGTGIGLRAGIKNTSFSPIVLRDDI